MNRRLALGCSLAALLAGLVVAGSSAQAAPTGDRQKLCVNVGGDGRLLPPSYCVTWVVPGQE